MRIFSHRKKIFFLGGIIALLVVAGATLTSIMKKDEASATEEEQVNLTINGKTGVSYFSIDGEYAWCVTPNLPNPVAGQHTATVYTFDELEKGVADGGESITNIRRMFISYYYASLSTEPLHSITNNDAMHWAMAYLYSGHDEYPSNGQNAKAIFDYYKNGFPSNLSDANVILVRDDANRQTIFTANYTVKTTYSQKLSVSKVWKDGIDARDHDISIQFKVKDNTTNSYITIDNDEIGELNKSNNWSFSTAIERGSDETPHSFSVEEIVTGNGFHTDTDPTTGDEYWYHDDLKDEDDNYIFYVMPSNDTQGCNESDPYNVTCTVYNKAYNLTTVSIWPTKRWADSGYTDYRPDGISYIIHAFVQVNGAYHEVTGLPKTGFPIVKGNTYHLENTYVWGGTYVSGMATQAEYEGEMYPVIYAIEEIQNDALSAYGLICSQNLNYEGHTYCLAEDKGDGSGDYKVEWTNALEKITVTAKKHWNDGGNAAGKRPEAVAYRIFRSINGATPSYYRTSYIMGGANDEDWAISITLPKMDKEGNIYNYTYQEVDYYDRGTDTYTSDNYILDGDVIGFSTADDTGIVNTAKTSIPVIKCFVDKDETKRPMSLDFELFSDKEDGAIQNLILTSADEDEDGCWRGEFDDLPVYDEDGEEITYTVTEDDSLLTDYELDEEYSICEVDAAENFAADDDDKKSCNFYNVQLIDIPVIKVWEEDSKEDRPGSIEVSLLCGDDVLDTVTLSEANNLDGDNIWEYTWKNRRIDECEQGYSVAENINIPGYATKITGNAEDGFVITNTKTLDEIMTWGSLGAGSFGIIAAGFFVVKRKLFARY